MRYIPLSILLLLPAFQTSGSTVSDNLFLSQPESVEVVQPQGADLEKVIRYPNALEWLYKVGDYELVWQDPTLVDRLNYQLDLLVDAQISPTFDQQRGRIDYVLEVGDSRDVDLVMMDSLLFYASYLEQLPENGKKWLFNNKKAIELPEPSMDTMMEIRDAMLAQKLDEYIDHSRSPLQNSSGFASNYNQLKNLTLVEIPTYEQSQTTRLGDDLENKRWLVERLSIAGVDVSMVDNVETEFDRQLEESIKEFQKIHGLEQDGIIGKNTMRWVNKQPAQRVHKLALNSERSRLWERDRSNLVMVNVPNYRVTYWKEGEALFDSKVIVGRTKRKTPIMTVDLDSVILNPTWNIPWKIMVKDILPKAKQDPMYLVRQNIQILPSWFSNEVIDPTTIDWKNLNPYDFPYKMRQASGNLNALGLYKFNMPNPQAIYLHDTPGKNLFRKDQRAFSSGCVRVQDADELAAVLFKSQGIESRLLNKQQSTRANNPVSLRERVPVHIIYQTAWVEDGIANYRDDIYSYDR